jgi:Rrf2 family protein
MLSQTAEYALRAAVWLADNADGPVRVGDLANALKVPKNYLSKTMHQMARAGVLSSVRGKNGGFTLARKPTSIKLLDIVRPFDPMMDRRECVLGRPSCSDANPCGAHERWKAVMQASMTFFSQTTLGDLMRRER